MENALAQAFDDILNKRKRHAPSENIRRLAEHISSVNSGHKSSQLETIWE